MHDITELQINATSVLNYSSYTTFNQHRLYFHGISSLKPTSADHENGYILHTIMFTCPLNIIMIMIFMTIKIAENLHANPLKLIRIQTRAHIINTDKSYRLDTIVASMS